MVERTVNITRTQEEKLIRFAEEAGYMINGRANVSAALRHIIADFCSRREQELENTKP